MAAQVIVPTAVVMKYFLGQQGGADWSWSMESSAWREMKIFQGVVSNKHHSYLSSASDLLLVTRR